MKIKIIFSHMVYDQVEAWSEMKSVEVEVPAHLVKDGWHVAGALYPDQEVSAPEEVEFP